MEKKIILPLAIAVVAIVIVAAILMLPSSEAKDTDGDGHPDTDDAFPNDPFQWIDSDGDGYGDNAAVITGDQFPNDPDEWDDYDNDGIGDNADVYIYGDLHATFYIGEYRNTQPNDVKFVLRVDTDGDGQYDTERESQTYEVDDYFMGGIILPMDVLLNINDTVQSIKFEFLVYDMTGGVPTLMTYNSMDVDGVPHTIATTLAPWGDEWAGDGYSNLVTSYPTCSLEYGALVGEPIIHV